MWLRDSVPPGQGSINDNDSYGYAYIRSWYSDSKNQVLIATTAMTLQEATISRRRRCDRGTRITQVSVPIIVPRSR